ncbi:MAG: type VI secretion system-associated FHA domain protein TagH [Candidatus Thiodiazotropha taylori]|nr:type VI secretion system-associated FHA domain protein TagH [Candidatus Thiodiazotropha taylori]
MYSDSNSATITLTVSLKAGSAPAQPMSTTFDQQGGSIGRRDENDWVLPDPERFISGRHALIFYSENAFHLTDTSSNGVFINRSATALGKDNVIKLEDGDTIGIGDYEISVSLPQAETLAADDFDNLDDPFAQMSEQLAGEPESVETPPIDAAADLHQPTEEPVYTLDEPDPSELVVEQSSDEVSPTPLSQTDHTSDLNAYFNQPTPIPEDWDLDESPSGAIPADEPIPSAEILPPLDDQAESQAPFPDPQAVGKEESAAPALSQESIPRPGLKTKPPAQPSSPPQSAPQSSPPPAPKPVTATAGTATDDAGLRQALASGLGVPESYLEGISLADLLGNLGSAMRANVEGTMSILRARAQMKGEFRMSQTMIQPVENNPLKFSINTEDALRHLVNPSQKSGYLPPLNAIEEAHEDIEAHMLAVMVGMQAALQVVLQRFKPEILEKRLGQSALLEKLPLYRHAKTWDLFTELYSEIAVEAEDDFHQLFGRTFSQAYEEQIRRLEALKHTDPNLDKRF